MLKKKIVFYLITFLFILVIYFIGGEIYARVKHGEVLGQQAREATFRKVDFQFHHSLIPNTQAYQIRKEWKVLYSINSFGLRDREYSLPKPANTYRILALGDSFTEGHGVELEETFVKILEKKLNQVSGTNTTYEVINCGVGSYSPLLEYLFYRRRLCSLNLIW